MSLNSSFSMTNAWIFRIPKSSYTLVVLILLCASSQSVYGQDSIHYYGWNSIERGHNYNPKDLIEMNEGCILIVSDINSPRPINHNNYFRKEFIQINITGDTVLTKFGLPSHSYHCGLGNTKNAISSIDNSVTFRNCNMGSSYGDLSDIRIQSVDDAGGYQVDTFNFDCSDMIRSLSRNKYGELVCLGSSDSLSIDINFIIKLDSMGELKKINVDTTSLRYFNVFDDGSFYYLYRSSTLTKVSYSGSIIWTRPISLTGTPQSFKRDKNGNFIFLRYTSYTTYLTKIDSSGNDLWENTYSFIGTDLLIQSSGNYFITGYKDSTLFRLTVDKSGNEIQQFKDSFNHTVKTIKTIELINGALVTLAGSTKTTYFEEFEGRVIVLITNLPPAVSIRNWNYYKSLKYHPNPTTGKISISMNEEIESIIIRDSHGQIIESLSPQNLNKLSIEVQGPPGVYYLETLSTRGITYRSKVIKI